MACCRNKTWRIVSFTANTALGFEMGLVLREMNEINSSHVKGNGAIKSSWNVTISPEKIRLSEFLDNLCLFHVWTCSQGFRQVQMLLSNFPNKLIYKPFYDWPGSVSGHKESDHQAQVAVVQWQALFTRDRWEGRFPETTSLRHVLPGLFPTGLGSIQGVEEGDQRAFPAHAVSIFMHYSFTIWTQVLSCNSHGSTGLPWTILLLLYTFLEPPLACRLW